MNNFLEVEGRWWIFGENEEPWLGTLRGEAGGYSLKVTGRGPTQLAAFTPRSYSLIHGQAFAGSTYSLEKCFDTASRLGGSGLITKEIYASLVFQGALLPEAPDERLFRA